MESSTKEWSKTMTAHIHAKLIIEYGNDATKTDEPWKLWRCKHISKCEWSNLRTHPEWHTFNIYERIPQAININGFEVPEPVRSELNHGDEYFIPSFGDFGGGTLIHECRWSSNEFNNDVCVKIDLERLNNGLIHLSREAAEIHCKALLSFTKGS